jgi:hypothetical protein
MHFATLSFHNFLFQLITYIKLDLVKHREENCHMVRTNATFEIYCKEVNALSNLVYF